ncbi:MAG TPA: radical SAM protein [bacterium]|nr:radical SAM protein [bacterium]
MNPSVLLFRKAFEKRIPLETVWELTRRCNLFCRHCYLPLKERRMSGNAERVSAPAGEIKKGLAELKKRGGLFLSFTGGEPLLLAGIWDILAQARRLAFDVRLFTNATLIRREEAGEICSLGLSAVEISLYGCEASTHDYYTCSPGSFERTVEGIRYLTGEGIAVWIKVLLMRKNIRQLNKMSMLAGELGARIRFDPLVGAGYRGDINPLKHRIALKEIGKLLKKSSADFSGELPACGAGRNIFSIDASGNGTPCLMLPISFGNVFEEGIVRVWKRLGSFSELHCEECAKRASCFYCPGMVYLEKGKAGGRYSLFCDMAGHA